MGSMLGRGTVVLVPDALSSNSILIPNRVIAKDVLKDVLTGAMSDARH